MTNREFIIDTAGEDADIIEGLRMLESDGIDPNAEYISPEEAEEAAAYHATGFAPDSGKEFWRNPATGKYEEYYR